MVDFWKLEFSFQFVSCNSVNQQNELSQLLVSVSNIIKFFNPPPPPTHPVTTLILEMTKSFYGINTYPIAKTQKKLGSNSYVF